MSNSHLFFPRLPSVWLVWGQLSPGVPVVYHEEVKTGREPPPLPPRPPTSRRNHLLARGRQEREREKKKQHITSYPTLGNAPLYVHSARTVRRVLKELAKRKRLLRDTFEKSGRLYGLFCCPGAQGAGAFEGGRGAGRCLFCRHFGNKFSQGSDMSAGGFCFCSAFGEKREKV